MKIRNARLAHQFLADVLATPSLARARIGCLSITEDEVHGIPVIRLDLVDDPAIDDPVSAEDVALDLVGGDPENIDRDTTVLAHGRRLRRTYSVQDLRGDAQAGYVSVRVDVSDYIRNELAPVAAAAWAGAEWEDGAQRLAAAMARAGASIEDVHAPILSGVSQ